jgi:hypothetical protein
MIAKNLKLVLFIIIAGTIAAYVVLVTIPTQLAKRSYDAARSLGEDFKKAFQFTPEIKVNNTIVLNQQTPILELAVLTQNFEHRYNWSNTWMGSTKQIAITGSFDTKVGFDLREKFSIAIRQDTAYVSLPAPSILSVESQGNISYRDEHGIWNWVNTDDRTKATNAFLTDARNYAEQAVFVHDAKQKMEDRLKALLQPHVKGVVIRYQEVFSLPDAK